MGLSHKDNAKREANLAKATPDETPAEPTIEVDRTGFIDPSVMRGFPMMDGKHGLPYGGAIRGTKPGDSLKHIEREARDLNDQARRIVQERMREARRRLNRDDA